METLQVHIKRGRRRDTAEIYQMEQALVLETNAQPSDFNLQFAQIKAKRQQFYVAHLGNHAVGMMRHFKGIDSWRGAPFEQVEDLYVKPEFRGYGVGRSLMAYAAKHAVLNSLLVEPGNPSRGEVRLVTGTEDNQATRAFYERLGMESHQVEYRLTDLPLRALAKEW